MGNLSKLAISHYLSNMKQNNIFSPLSIIFIGLLCILNVKPLQAQNFTPVDLPNLLVWLKADSGVITSGTAVTQWNDGGGTVADNVTQATAGNRPDYVADGGPLINGKPVLLFDGTDLLTGGNILGVNDTSLSVFILANKNQQAATAGLFMAGPTTGNSFAIRKAVTTGNYSILNNGTQINSPANIIPDAGAPYKLYEAIKSFNSNMKGYINGDSVMVSTAANMTGPFTNGAYLVGRVNNNSTWWGNIAEVVVYRKNLTTVERKQVEDYLFNKYAPPVNLGADVAGQSSLCPVVLNASKRFVSYLWSNGSTADTLLVSASGSYWVRVTDVFGRISSDTVHIALPSLSFLQQDTTICLGDSINISSNLSAGPYSLLWSNGSTQPNITVYSAGSYYLTVTDNISPQCSVVSAALNIGVDSFKTVVSLGPDTSLCSGNVIGLAAPAAGWGTFSFLWQPGAVTTATYTLSNSGTYTLQVTNARGCKAYDTIAVTITGNAPNADFVEDTLCLGQLFMPVNTSVSNDASPIVSYQWSFGDGGTSNLAAPQYIYAATGIYNVSLTVTTAAGCSDEKIVSVPVSDVTALFASPAQGCINNAVAFSDLSAASTGSTLQQWQWQFGDGGMATTQNAQHTYSGTGLFSTRLIATNNYGCADTVLQSIDIVASAPAANSAQLSTPANNISLSSGVGIYFAWSGNSSRYTLVVANNSQFIGATNYSTSATNQIVSLPSSNTYYWKIRTYNICNDSTESETFKFLIFSPSDISNMLIWLRGDSGVVAAGTAVTQWNDAGGIVADNLTQGTAGNRPDYVANGGPLINNKPVLHFDGTDVLNGGTVQGINDTSLSVFILASKDAQPAVGSGLFMVGASTGTGFALRTSTTGNYNIVNNGSQISSVANIIPDTGAQYRIYGVVKSLTSNIKGYINSDSVTVSTTAAMTGPFTNGSYMVGRTTTNSTWWGNIAEVLVYRRALTTGERTQVENYLYDKYAPPVDLGSDIKEDYRLCPIAINAGPRFVRYVWSTGDTTQQISVQISGDYWVRVTDVFGRVSADTVKVNTPYKGMAFADTLLCYGNTAIVQPILTASPYTYLWNTGQNTASITTGAPNSYVLAITDTNGCIFIADTTYIMVDSFELVSLLPTDTISCKGNVLAIDSNGYSVTAVQWSTGAISPAVFIDTAGVYTVTATDINQCTVSDAIDITVKGTAPLADFSKTDACFGNANIFTDLSVPAPLDNLSQWQWDFGDGNAAAAQNTNHIYNFGGTYPVTLVVGTDSGCTASVTKYVDVFSLPSANFTQLAPVCAGSPANLSDISNAPVGTSIVDWNWLINGTAVSTQQNAVVTFAQQGINPLTLIVTTAQGCSDTIVKNVEAFPALLADFEVANVCVGDSSYFFDVTPSYSVINRTWVFGDGSPISTLKNPVRKYTQPGNYNVLLTVRNAIGCQDTVLKTVTAAGKPIAKFGNLIGCEDAFYTPLDSSTSAQEPVNSWQWVIGGFEYNTQAPNRYFATPGTYPVKLVVATETGCADSVTRTVTIQPRPVANFNFTPLYGEAPLDVTFTNLSTGAATYLWQFGDGGNSTLVSPVHTYGTNGNYDVSLTAVSQFGCTNTRTKPYTVIPTDLDFSVDEASVIVTPLPDGSSLAQVVVQGSNINTRIINQVGFYVSMGGVGVLAEDWTGTLYTGQVLLDTFSAKFVVPAGKGDSYICVTAMSVNNGQTETRTDNNSQCISIDEGLQLIGPLPNPALNQSVLGIVLPKQGKVTIDIADMMGQYLIQGEELELAEGRSDYNLPVGQMTAGEYFIRISYNDEKVVRKLVIRR